MDRHLVTELLLGAGLATSLGLQVAAPAARSAGELQVSRLELVDDAGQVLAILGSTPGGALLSLHDAAGVPVVRLGVEPQGRALLSLDRPDGSHVSLQQFPGGGGLVVNAGGSMINVTTLDGEAMLHLARPDAGWTTRLVTRDTGADWRVSHATLGPRLSLRASETFVSQSFRGPPGSGRAELLVGAAETGAGADPDAAVAAPRLQGVATLNISAGQHGVGFAALDDAGANLMLTDQDTIVWRAAEGWPSDEFLNQVRK